MVEAGDDKENESVVTVTDISNTLPFGLMVGAGDDEGNENFAVWFVRLENETSSPSLTSQTHRRSG